MAAGGGWAGGRREAVGGGFKKAARGGASWPEPTRPASDDMVRTKADAPSVSTGAFRKAVAARAPRKALGCTSAASNSLTSPGKKENKYAGGNSVCPRPTPKWQKGIGDFFGGGPSKLPEKENTVPSDDEPTSSTAEPKKAQRRARPLSAESSDEAASCDEN